ncbi:MAG: hypothetical protein WD045_05605 [Pirellulaceae bacterium]
MTFSPDNRELHGVLPVLHENGAIDFATLQREIDWALEVGANGIVLAIEKYLMKKRGIFPNTIQRQPVGWELDAETMAAVDRLFQLSLA